MIRPTGCTSGLTMAELMKSGSFQEQTFTRYSNGYPPSQRPIVQPLGNDAIPGLTLVCIRLQGIDLDADAGSWPPLGLNKRTVSAR